MILELQLPADARALRRFVNLLNHTGCSWERQVSVREGANGNKYLRASVPDNSLKKVPARERKA